MDQIEKDGIDPVDFRMTRRRLLIGLAAIAPASVFLRPTIASAASDDDAFLRASRVITGNDSLSADVALRIHELLTKRIDRFESRLGELDEAMQKTGGGRDQMLAALTDSQVDFAIDIARPWYLGYVGKPSDFVLKDDAVFATFLEAQSYQKIIDEVPRPTYPSEGPGWWDVAPPNVGAPPMPEEIKSWTFHPGGPARIMAPDPEWKAYATVHHASIEEARQKKPGARKPPEGK